MTKAAVFLALTVLILLIVVALLTGEIRVQRIQRLACEDALRANQTEGNQQSWRIAELEARTAELEDLLLGDVERYANQEPLS